MTNRLRHEASPYLLQHAENPVDWYPWGPEALERARREDKPILLSIGYSACHWCHVMERESFEDPATAELMNRLYVNIKVDREERPDVDSVYMRAVHLLTGHGGWPLTVFLLPDGRAFFGGTYFPPEPRHGMPSFSQVLTAVHEAFRSRRDAVEAGSRRLLDALSLAPRGPTPDPGLPPAVVLEEAVRSLATAFDPEWGGFGPAPKFPQAATLEFLLTEFHRSGSRPALEMALTTLRAMASGGIRDHLGGGFHRYSVDGRWRVPHFEKMLYDNALLARTYLHAAQLTGSPLERAVAAAVLDDMLEEMGSEEGAFHASLDADAEGEEGRFYLWRPEEIRTVLGPDEAEPFSEAYHVTEEGNFEGANILYLDLDARPGDAPGADPEWRFAASREALREARARRPRPFRDEKIVTGWNALAVRALAEAGAALGIERYLERARACAEFLLASLYRDGRLHRSWKEGRLGPTGFLEDYAGFGNALLTLYETTLEVRWLDAAEELEAKMVDLFHDTDSGAFFDSPRDGEALVVRPRDPTDGALPSGSSLAVELLLRLAALRTDEEKRGRAVVALGLEEGGLRRAPSAFGHLLSSLALAHSSPCEIVVMAGEECRSSVPAWLGVGHEPFLPFRRVAGAVGAERPDLPLLEGREAGPGGITAYVCVDSTCSAPLRTPAEFREELARHARLVDRPAAEP